MAKFSTILVANRGEIACRVMRTARALGYRTVAVYSEADRDAPHVRLADRAVCIGPAPVGQSYLRIEKIIEAARQSGADAVHPGYGFLSENEDFAEACAAAGITFIGPPVKAIELMGSKRLSKIAMIQAGVPCVPGYEGAEQSEDKLVAEAKRIGFPVMLKASAGGGGRGMRLVQEERELLDLIRTAKSEAKNAFGSDELIIEKAVINPRHVEIQVFGDTHGNVIHLGERDCSIQRRHQKVVEESPCPVMTPGLRNAMGMAAVNAAKAVHYTGAGTVEFLLDGEKFYFLEMNTRLQVEHPVTEEVTGLDLVAWQIRVAAGEKLPLTQDQVRLNGAAIEVRLYAEDPADRFLPQTGPVLLWRPATGDGVRIDHGIATGGEISPHYDPMVAKVIARGATREEARHKLIRALEDTVLLGVTVNKRFLLAILRHDMFAGGIFGTAFIASVLREDPSLQPVHAGSRELALAAALMHARTQSGRPLRSGLLTGRPALLSDGTRKTPATVTETIDARGRAFRVVVAGTAHQVVVLAHADSTWRVEIDGVLQDVAALAAAARVLLDAGNGMIAVDDLSLAPPAAAEGAGSGQLKAPMDGAIITINVRAGERVEKGQVLILLEAMKIQHQITADVAGTIRSVNVSAGSQVKARHLLAVIEPDNPAPANAS
ncbi:MAG: acetyl/propionyl/methylcrotonyl-CoA carboxylase subunit alpha [Pseudomonadota bacterium]